MAQQMFCALQCARDTVRGGAATVDTRTAAVQPQRDSRSREALRGAPGVPPGVRPDALPGALDIDCTVGTAFGIGPPSWRHVAWRAQPAAS